MKVSALHLVRYFVPEISCTANRDYDDEKDVEYSPEQFTVEHEVSPSKENDYWMIELTINQLIGPGQNLPYEFKLVIIGFFTCADEIPAGLSKEAFLA